MGIRMAAPIRHSESGIYWFRRRVPSDLVAVVGRREIKFSLATRDPSEARTSYARISTEVEAKWAALRKSGAEKLTHKEMHALAGEYYRALLAEHEDDPPEVDDLQWERTFDLFAGEFDRMVIHRHGDTPDGAMRPIDVFRQESMLRRRKAVQTFLTDRSIVVRPDDLDRLVVIVARGAKQARDQLIRYKEGNYRPDPDADRFPPWQPKNADAERPASDFELLKIYKDYSAEARHTAGTRKKWSRLIAEVAAVHADVRTITPLWCVQWKDALIKRGLSTKTVQEGHLAALRSTLAWATKNRRLDKNPLDGITVRIVKKSVLRDPGYTDEEAVVVLGLTLKPVEGRLRTWMRRVRRWVPWLCAYTGARVGEIAQLRKEDVKQRLGVWMLWITPEAGTVKTNDARWVALHEHLIQQGFLDFVAGLKNGPLFYNPIRTRGGSDENPPARKVGERLAEWLRSEGMVEEIAPNHAWRHRFKTMGRDHFLHQGALDYLQGHAPATEGGTYGQYRPGFLLAEISKLPAYQVPGLILPETSYKQPPPIPRSRVHFRPEDLAHNSRLGAGFRIDDDQIG